MQAADRVPDIVEKIRSASTACETTFLKIGQTLEESVGTISGMAQSFDAILVQLKGQDLSEAVAALTGVAGRIAALDSDRASSSAQFAGVNRRTEVIAARLMKMAQAVQTIFPLVTNSKIAIAAIRTSTVDFSTFADDIRHTADTASRTLEAFRTKLQTLRRCFQEAYAVQLAFEARQKEATRVIPGRLRATIGLLPTQHRQITEAVSTVQRRSESVHAQICKAILALQTGDAARQRLEHIEYAFDLMAGQKSAKVQGPPLTEAEHQTFVQTTCRLQADQLCSTSEQFRNDTQQVATALKALTTEAQALRALAQRAYGASDKDRSTFMGALEVQVGEALSLFTDFEKTQSQAATAMTSVFDTAEHLHRDLKTIQSLEADIRIMGLNASLRCARVGPEGRALDLIAQELRNNGDIFAKEADTLMGEVQSLTAATRSIETSGADAARLIADSRHAMERALHTLQHLGQTVTGTLAGLDRDSCSVASLLDETAPTFDHRDEIGHAMQGALAILRDGMTTDELSLDDIPGAVTPMLEQMAAIYTMAEERTVYSRLFGQVPASAAPAASVELEDMLF